MVLACLTICILAWFFTIIFKYAIVNLYSLLLFLNKIPLRSRWRYLSFIVDRFRSVYWLRESSVKTVRNPTQNPTLRTRERNIEVMRSVRTLNTHIVLNTLTQPLPVLLWDLLLWLGWVSFCRKWKMNEQHSRVCIFSVMGCFWLVVDQIWSQMWWIVTLFCFLFFPCVLWSNKENVKIFWFWQ